MLLGVHLVPWTLGEAAFKMKLNKNENYVEWHRPTICIRISDLTNSDQVQLWGDEQACLPELCLCLGHTDRPCLALSHVFVVVQVLQVVLEKILLRNDLFSFLDVLIFHSITSFWLLKQGRSFTRASGTTVETAFPGFVEHHNNIIETTIHYD